MCEDASTQAGQAEDEVLATAQPSGDVPPASDEGTAATLEELAAPEDSTMPEDFSIPEASAASAATAAALTPMQEKLRDILIAQGRADENADFTAIDAHLDESTFGGRIAEQVGGADLSAEREENQSEKDKAMAEGAKVKDWKTALSEMSFNQRVEATLESMSRRPAVREIMTDLLKYCRTQRQVDEAEAWISQHRNFEKLRQSPHQYIFFMQRTGALAQTEYDSDGVLITDDMRDELRELGVPEEEIEDMEVEWRVQTTDVGEEALRQSDPKDKIRKLLGEKLSRRATYDKVISFCEQPRSMEEIFQYLQGDPGLEVNAQGIMQCQPSAYVSHLEEAGALVWDKGGWRLTKEGAQLLKTIRH